MSTTPRLELVDDIEMVDAHGRLVDKVTDMAGRFPSGDSTNGSGMSNGERHNIALDIERRLVKQIAAGINRIVKTDNGTTWYFAAPSTINQRLLDELKPEVKNRLTKNVAADLTKIDKSELLSHF